MGKVDGDIRMNLIENAKPRVSHATRRCFTSVEILFSVIALLLIPVLVNLGINRGNFELRDGLEEML
jgi:hypothetical protein